MVSTVPVIAIPSTVERVEDSASRDIALHGDNEDAATTNCARGIQRKEGRKAGEEGGREWERVGESGRERKGV